MGTLLLLHNLQHTLDATINPPRTVYTINMNNDGEDKYGLEHVEDNVGEKVDTVAEAFDKGQTATGYESLGILATVKTFKMASAICFAATFAAAADGYQSA